MLVSLQSHAEVLNALDAENAKLFVASVSPQVRASLAATYHVSEQEAGYMIDQLLGGPLGLASGGKHGNSFKWIVDTNAMREASLVLGAEEVAESLSAVNNQQSPYNDGASSTRPKAPVLSSACPGWICYAEKTHPHVLPHLSRLKSPQALTGTLLKTVLSQRLNLRPDQIWHVAIMPCFDKKLEASREELTDIYWRSSPSSSSTPPVRDVDCVITARELLMLSDTRGISFPSLPCQPLSHQTPFPDPTLSAFLFPSSPRKRTRIQNPEAGTSGGYLHHILQTQLSAHPGSTLTSTRGRNADVVEYTIQPFSSSSQPTPIFKAARYYGFRNIQNLVRKLRPPKPSRMPGTGRTLARARVGASVGIDYAYVEVMACPGGCTNGGGQIKVDDIPGQGRIEGMGQKEWLGKVDEAYYSMSDTDEDNVPDSEAETHTSDHTAQVDDTVNGISPTRIKAVLEHWASSTGIPLKSLVTTSYRQVESDVGKTGGGDSERVVELAGKIGGGW